MIVTQKIFGQQVGIFEKIRGKLFLSLDSGDSSILYKKQRATLERGSFKQKFEISVKRQNRSGVGVRKAEVVAKDRAEVRKQSGNPPCGTFLELKVKLLLSQVPPAAIFSHIQFYKVTQGLIPISFVLFFFFWNS